MQYIIYNLPKDIKYLTQAVSLLDSRGSALMHSDLAINTTPLTTEATQAGQGTRIRMPNVRGRYSLVVMLRDAKGLVDVQRRTDFVVD